MTVIVLTAAPASGSRAEMAALLDRQKVPEAIEMLWAVSAFGGQRVDWLGGGATAWLPMWLMWHIIRRRRSGEYKSDCPQLGTVTHREICQGRDIDGSEPVGLS
jgi:hypothetical protein